MKKQFTVIRKENKDIMYNIIFNEVHSIRLTYAFNSLSGTYFGFQIKCFTDSLIAVLKSYPDFLQDYMVTKELEKWLLDNGFEQVEPNKLDLMIDNF